MGITPPKTGFTKVYELIYTPRRIILAILVPMISAYQT